MLKLVAVLASAVAAVWLIFLMMVNKEDWRIAAYNKVLQNLDAIDQLKLKEAKNKKIFSKFFQVESAKTEASTGLGLTIAKEFTKLHDGNISVKSEENQGAEFIIKLPHARCYC